MQFPEKFQKQPANSSLPNYILKISDNPKYGLGINPKFQNRSYSSEKKLKLLGSRRNTLFHYLAK